MSDLKFDPTQDLDVSTRHGEIRLVAGRYTVYDAKSTNGTFVNGQRVAPGGVRELSDNDVVMFGAQGPSVAVRIFDGAAPMTRVSTSAASAPSVATAPRVVATPDPLTATTRRSRTTGERVALAVAEQTRKLRLIVAAAVVVLGGAAGLVFYRSSRVAAQSRAQIDQLVAANSKLQTEFETKLQGDTALTNSLRRRADSLARIAREATGAQLATATAQLRANHDLQRKLSEMDPAAIVAKNKNAMALITTRNGSGQSEATGFVVSPTGLVITNRHVVIDSLGNRVSSVFVRLAGSSGVHRAQVVRVAEDSVDLAVVQIEGTGPFPSVRVAPRVDAAPGEAVVTLGFPYGTDLPMDNATVEPSLTMGKVSRSITDLLQIDSFASQGASGSPVFDAHGHVVGVVWGGQKGAGGRIVFCVPADRITELVKAGR
jgi:S1-C subfamily serine protease